MKLCAVGYCCYSCVGWYLDQIEALYSASIPIQVIFSMIWFSMEIMIDDVYATVQEISQYTSQEFIICSLRCKVG